jgi:hypothetical protein
MNDNIGQCRVNEMQFTIIPNGGHRRTEDDGERMRRRMNKGISVGLQ